MGHVFENEVASFSAAISIRSLQKLGHDGSHRGLTEISSNTCFFPAGIACFACAFDTWRTHKPNSLIPVLIQGFKNPTNERHCVNSKALKFAKK